MSNGNNSGLYEWSDPAGVPFSREELRLDVDGDFPQLIASGTGFSGLNLRVHWIARPLTVGQTENGLRWSGPIALKLDSAGIFQYTQVSIETAGPFLEVTFSGAGLPDLIRDFAFVSPFFRKVELEFDAEQGVDLTLDYQTNDHPDRPAGLAAENLTIDTVFERAGFEVVRTGQDTIVPSSASGSNASWSDAEMHDAMQVHFSALAGLPPSQRDRARWALWTFFAGIHDDGKNLGGIMFDSIGAAERQGTALFVNSFIADAPAGDAKPDAWVQRMTFWTAVHEMGHAFNLLHAWQKTLGAPWIPQVDSFDLLSFMNYPFLYQTGSFSNANTIRFFRDFMFRFSDDELLFLRHAPEPFVQMGNADFGVNHAFEQARVSPDPAFGLELRTHRGGDEFEFLEPAMIELKLTNRNEQPQLVDERLLEVSDRMTVIVQRRGGSQKTYHPYSQTCYRPQLRTLEPGASIYAPLFLSASGNGWMIDEPGWYDVRICLHLDDEDIVSNSLRLRIAPPYTRDEEYLAQDFFSDDVGRTLSFDGTCCLTKANDVLAETSARLKDRKVAIHADVALHMPKTRDFKLLTQTNKGYAIREVPAEEQAVTQLAQTLGSTAKRSKTAAEALGHIDYQHYVQTACGALKKMERDDLGLKLTQAMYDTFKERKVLNTVLRDIRKTIKATESRAKS
ncbi:MAG: hypothetical protein AAF657_35235 [Acidobacteriota bacterium]